MKENGLQKADLEELIEANGGYDGGTMEQFIEWMKEHGIPYEGPHMNDTIQEILDKIRKKDPTFAPHGSPVGTGPSGPTSTSRDPLR